MSRLERLVSLLDTGSSVYVRNVAGDQLADVQRAHPEELYNLLARVVPFLQSSKWDTRISSARAIGLIIANFEWNDSSVHELKEIKEEDGVKVEDKVEIKEEVDDLPSPSNGANANGAAGATGALTFSTLDIKQVVCNGTPLQRSAGKEYEQSLAGMDAQQRMAAQHAALKKTLGFTAQFEDSAMLSDDDLDLAPPPPKKRGRKVLKKEPEPEPEPEPVSEAPVQNARMRALAKRKAKFTSKQPAKVQVQESKSKAGSPAEKVTVQHNPDKDKELVEFVTVADPEEWPFAKLCALFASDMFSPQWEIRHGALLGLRELLKAQGQGAGMNKRFTAERNLGLHHALLEDLSCRMCCVFSLDRFADYVADQVVAPVRESCAQTLAALFMHLDEQTSIATFNTLQALVLQQQLGIEHMVWAVCHGGMLGLRYFVSVRPDILINNGPVFDKLVECVFHGLENSDDDVQAISAAALLPIADDFVKQRPQDIEALLKVIWDSLSNLKDELSTSIGNVMDLLAKLCSHEKVLTVLVGMGSDLKDLIPRLYPFFRHSIVDVRRAVLRTLRIFVSDQGGITLDWIDARFVRLLFQNILLEQKPSIAQLSLDLWLYMLEVVRGKPDVLEIMQSTWATNVKLLMTPIGTSRRFYKMEASLLIKPSGAAYDPQELLGKSEGHHVNVDGPVLLGDVLIVDPDVFLFAKVNGAIALGQLMSSMPRVMELLPSVMAFSQSPMSSQHLVLALLMEEYGKTAPEPCAELVAAVSPYLSQAMESLSEATYRDLNPILRAVRTQCQSLFSLMASQGNLPQSSVPILPTAIEGDTNAGPTAFNLKFAEELASTKFQELKAQLSEDVQVAMEASLAEGRQNLLSAIAEAKESLQKRNVSMKSSAAAAFIALNKELPSKLNPIIRSLMDAIKLETNTVLHKRTASTVASLIATLNVDRAATSGKIVKNLCSFVCVDTSEAPLFESHKAKEGIMSLKVDAPVEDIAEELRRKKETDLALIKRTGAIYALENLAKHYGASLFEQLAELKTRVIDNVQNEEAQQLIDSLAVLSAIVPFVDRALHADIQAVFGSIEAALFGDYAVVRYAAAKCFATICRFMPTAGITFFVERLLPQVSNGRNLSKRQGAVEVAYHIMSSMGEQVLPYIVFFIVPILGRMSDVDTSVRNIAATTFAVIIKLVPLESGIEDPSDMPQALLEGRDKEREFIGQMMDITKVKPFELPISVKATLRKYQQDGVNWLAFLNKYHLHGILCDDMGLGKTLQTICMVASDHHMRREQFEATKNEDFKTLPSLIICPTTLTGHWIQEFSTYVPGLKVLGYVGNPTSRSALASRIKRHDVVVTSYDIARNDVEILSKERYNYCVLDEGHIIKNANSKLSRSIKRYTSEHRLVLTGTPIQNNVLELWSLFDFLMPGFLGTEKMFNETFSKPIIASRNSSKAGNKEQESAALALEALHKQVLPFMLRRLKEDVLDDLPPKIIQDYYCDLNDKQRKLYEQFTLSQKQAVAEELGESNKEAKKHIFQALLYMRRLCNHPSFVTLTKPELERAQPLDYQQSPKLLALQQLLKDCGIGLDHTTKTDKGEIPEAMSQHRALVFCQQKDMLDLVENSLLRANMPSVSYMRLDSSVSGPARHEMVRKFNDDPSIDLLLLSTHVGGLGLNLTGADTVIFVEHDWNPMNDLQAMDRAHRIGQKKVVNVYRLITRGTLEERIMGLQEFKMNIASTVVNQQNSGLMSMDTDQILDLFSAGGDVPEDKPKSKSKGDDILGATGAVGEKNIVGELDELWDNSQYAEEYDLDNFISSLKK